MQNTSHVMMVEPVAFHYNKETAATNTFMHSEEASVDYQVMALKEFNNLVSILSSKGVTVNVFRDTIEHDTPDSIFPNNWISTHNDGRLVLYPMQAPNRRKERRKDIVEKIYNDYGYGPKVDLSELELKGEYLESTGCLILDRINKIAYCALSDRATSKALNKWKEMFPEYIVVSFKALNKDNREIYHTNVMMCIGEEYAVVCLDSVVDQGEKAILIDSLESTNKEIIPITLDQVYQFAGNMLELKNSNEEKLLVMSTSANNSLYPSQIAQMEKYASIVHSDVSHIETIAGGSVRCMICEVFPPSQT